MAKSINIRPTTSVYATYKNIRYDPWTAIAEFVDNSTQSYYDNILKLESTKYWDGLQIDIEYKKDKGKLVIDEDEAPLIKAIFDIYANDSKIGLKKLSTTLQQEGYYNHNGNAIHQNTLKRIIQK